MSAHNIGRRAALEARLLKKRTGAKKAAAIKLIPRDGPLPVSPAQQRIWMFDQLVSDSSVNNVSLAERLQGPLSVKLLLRAFDKIILRHETLRFCFEVIDDQLMTRPAGELPQLRYEKLDVPEGQRSDLCHVLMRDMSSVRFDLESEAPVKAALYEFAPDDFLFICVINHIACDEWSIRRFQSEFAAHYEAGVSSTEPDVPALPVQYADFAGWQNRGLAEGRWSEARSYWKAHLDCAPSDVKLPHATSHEGPAGRGAAVREAFIVDPETVRQLDEAGHRRNTTPFTVMLAAALAYLHCSGDQEDLAITSLTAARTRPELDGLVGMFTNNAVIRSRATGDTRFGDVIEQTRDLVSLAIRYQDYPFDVMVQTLKVDRRDVPFSTVMFTHRDTFSASVTSGEVRSTAIPNSAGPAKFGLWFSIVNGENGRTVRLVADEHRYTPEALAAFAQDFSAFLDQLAAEPDLRLDEMYSPVSVALAQAAQGEVEADRHPASPETERKVADLWRDILGSEPPGVSSSFFDAGGDSLLLMQLVHRIDEEFGDRLTMREVFWEPTVRGISHHIDNALSESPRETAGSPPVPDEPDPAIVPLVTSADQLQTTYFLVSGAGGHVLPFSPMARRMPKRWRGVGLVDPGFFPEGRDLETIEEAGRWLMEKARTVLRNGPFIIVGYSYGAYAAYEMARQLRESDLPVGVIILDTRARRYSLKRWVRRVGRSILSLVRRPLEAVRVLPTPHPKQTWPENALYDNHMRKVRERRFAMAKNQRSMAGKYRLGNLDVPLIVIRARKSIRPDDAEDYEWSAVASVLDILLVEGSHLDMFKGVNETVFVEVLARALVRMSAELGLES